MNLVPQRSILHGIFLPGVLVSKGKGRAVQVKYKDATMYAFVQTCVTRTGGGHSLGNKGRATVDKNFEGTGEWKLSRRRKYPASIGAAGTVWRN